jgi:hypothetical protein
MVIAIRIWGYPELEPWDLYRRIAIRIWGYPELEPWDLYRRFRFQICLSALRHADLGTYTF